MSAYTGFAEVYDLFMDNIEYDEWSKYIIALLKEYNIEDGIILDMGCGTGNITERLSDAGFDMIGIDNSYEMLDIAMKKRAEGGYDSILYLCQDMREFELYGTVRAVVSVCDSMNYITSYEDMVTVFRLVNNYLDPGGIFVFDLKTDSYYRKLGDKTIAETRDEGSFIWENNYYEDDKINEYNLTIFTKREGCMYEKNEEFHQQRAYSLQEIQKALKESGMEFLCAYNAFTRDEAKKENDRIYILAREKGKKL